MPRKQLRRRQKSNESNNNNMSNIIDGLIKGVSGFLPQDDPDVKILTAQTELRELSEKEEKIFARLGRAVYDTDGGESHPEIITELEVLFNNRYAAEERLQAARDEKILREKTEAEERARREAEEAAYSCPNCGSHNSPGTNFCQGCGTRLAPPAQAPAAKRFCSNCGAEVAAGYRFCSSCGTQIE